MLGEKTKATPTPTPIKEEEDDEHDYWDKPFTSEELEAIDAAFQAGASQSSTFHLSPSSSCSSLPLHDLRRLPGSINRQLDSASLPCSFDRQLGSASLPRSFDRQLGSASLPRSFDRQVGSALLPCSTNRPSLHLHGNMKMKYPTMNFGGRIVYCRTLEEVEESTLKICRLLEIKRRELGRAVLGVDIEWKPSFGQGIPQGKAAVLQVCGDMKHCYVLHIIHSGVPYNLRSLLEDPTYIKVGVGIENDGVKMLRDHNVSLKSVEDLSNLANKKLGGVSKQWSLSSLVETLTCKQLLKPKEIRLGNWEAGFLSKPQLQYAATDAFASWYVYEVLHSFPDLSESQSAGV